MKYIFRREDNRKLVRVSWEQMMESRDGFITLEDGVLARRCLHLEKKKLKKKRKDTGERREIVSDSLGFTTENLADFEKDRKENGFGGIEFTPDPAVPEFTQVRCKSRAEFDRYMVHRGFVNKNTFGGVRLSEEELDRAKALVTREYPCETTN